MVWGRFACLLVSLSVMPGLVASAAPPEDPPEEAPACDCEDCFLDRARTLNKEAKKIEAEDLARAIELWEEAYVLRPKQSTSSALANAHRKAYERDHKPVHLHKAREFFARNLDSLGADDEEARKEVEGELASIDAEFARLEQEEQDRILTAERTRVEKVKEAEEHAAALRRKRLLHFGSGGALLGLGVGFSSVMAVALAKGAKLDADNDRLGADIDTTQSEYEALAAEGAAANRRAWGMGVTGGVLLASGLALVIVGVVRDERPESTESDHARLELGAEGLTLRF